VATREAEGRAERVQVAKGVREEVGRFRITVSFLLFAFYLSLGGSSDIRPVALFYALLFTAILVLVERFVEPRRAVRLRERLMDVSLVSQIRPMLVGGIATAALMGLWFGLGDVPFRQQDAAFAWNQILLQGLLVAPVETMVFQAWLPLIFSSPRRRWFGPIAAQVTFASFHIPAFSILFRGDWFLIFPALVWVGILGGVWYYMLILPDRFRRWRGIGGPGMAMGSHAAYNIMLVLFAASIYGVGVV
jgi:hypothetical protein